MNAVARNASQWGSWLKARRTELEMTQQELAAKTGISVKLISAYENNYVQPRKENRQLLLEALDSTRPPESGAPPAGGTMSVNDVARLVGLSDAKILVTWTNENGLAAIAAAHDNRLLTIRVCVVPSTRDDLRSLRALIARLDEQLQDPAP